MRERRTRTGVVHHGVPAPNIDGATVGKLDAIAKQVVHSLVVDVSKTTVVVDEALLFMVWLAQRLESAGGTLSVTAHEAPRGARVTRTRWTGVLTCVPGVNAALDNAIVRRLTVRAGGEALR